MIVGTAGHIDHGKTTLVKALTGVDTDRLPQEKERGITIELGYAYLDDAAGRQPLGFVDVPGHERLVHTMLAGASGIDFGMLVVAADDGPMPQTLEHLAILALLGIHQGVAVLSKCDRVDTERRAAVRAEVESLLGGAGLASYPCLEVSAASGEGVDQLRSLLRAHAARQPDAGGGEGKCRLAIDRVFTLEGIGTVAAGPLHAGSVGVGDVLRLLPGDRALRVRSMHAQGRAVTRAFMGQRAALALAGIHREEIARGQWLVDSEVVSVTERLDVKLRLWPGEKNALRSGARVHVHLGAEALTASVAHLDRELLLPGEEGLLQLVCDRAIGAWHRDRVVLRDASASRTLAGGIVLDPAAPARYRRTAQRLAQLQALALEDPASRITALLAASPHGIALADYQRRQAGAALPWCDSGLRLGDWLLDKGQAEGMMAGIVQVLESYHRAHPLDAGLELQRLRRLACPRCDPAAFRALIQLMSERGKVGMQGAFVHHPDHALRLSAREKVVSEALLPSLRAAGFQGAWIRDLVKNSRHEEAIVRATLSSMARAGQAHPVVKDLYYAPETIDELVAIALRLAEAVEERGVRAAQFRDAIGLGRHRAIQILEYFDRIGVLRRVGDLHRVRADSAWARNPGPVRPAAVDL